MIQLSFQPAFDPFHAVYRILRLFPILYDMKSLHKDQVRILDYYMLFPFRISGIRLLPKHRRFKSLASRYEGSKPYGNQPDDHMLFERMEQMQIAALQTLAIHRFINLDELRVGIVKAVGQPIPFEIEKRITAANNEDAELLIFFRTLVSDYPLSGPNGLKDRTALLEFRYDTI